MTPLERLKARYPDSTLEVLAGETGLSLATIHFLVHPHIEAGAAGCTGIGDGSRRPRLRTLKRLEEWAQREHEKELAEAKAAETFGLPAKGASHVRPVSRRRK